MGVSIYLYNIILLVSNYDKIIVGVLGYGIVEYGMHIGKFGERHLLIRMIVS